MLKNVIAAFGLVLGLAFFSNAVAQCGPSEVYFENHTDCDKVVTVHYGFPCTILGTSSMILPCCGASVCVPIPFGMEPIQYDVFDPASGNTGTVTLPGCGGTTQSFYMDCNNMCNLVQWEDPWRVLNLPD